MKICGFIKAKDEIIQSANIYRAIANLRQFCDEIVACDDASVDGTREYLQSVITPGHLVIVPPAEHSFRRELFWKQKMLDVIHAKVKPDWIFWCDADEELDARGTVELRAFAESALKRHECAWRFQYRQIWRVDGWERTDDGFADGQFIKLWRYSPDLTMAKQDGTHHYQCPTQIYDRLDNGVGVAPFECLHFGNRGKNLVFKAVKYFGGLGGVDRHLDFAKAKFGPYPNASKPPSTGPMPYTKEQIAMIKDFQDLKNREGYFFVALPAYNRAATLPRALESLQAQTYNKWIAAVVDDGSTDETQVLMKEWVERDPRIFYVRYPLHKGAVAIAEHYLEMASQYTEYFTRLGSDDWMEPTKLELDAAALQTHDGCFGPFRVFRDGRLMELCNPPESPADVRQALLGEKRFKISWANFACRTSALRKVKEKYGRYCSDRLLNCEDFLLNSRLVRFADFVWRGTVGGQVVINPSDRVEEEKIQFDAVWRCVTTGCSGNVAQTASEEVVTRQLIEQENATWADTKVA